MAERREQVIYRRLSQVMSRRPKLVELGPGAIIRRSSVDMTVFGPLRVIPDYSDIFRKNWFTFHDKNGDLLAPGHAPARTVRIGDLK